ncbi:MAG TPA: T9SS type A sorting domain-containing protein [Chitinophagaceae bacterium]|nr:T9SS type A sorting domain-containing protein [Chitinophagaceae bacterium]
MIRILSILSFIFILNVSSTAQEPGTPAPDGTKRIMKIYPNPAVSFIKFDFQKDYERGYTLHVLNFIGRQVNEIKNINASTTLDLSSYNRGVYIYQLKDMAGKLIESGKFQVAR